VSRRSNAPSFKPLATYMNGEYVGLWQLTPRGDKFQYADTWIASATSRPISLKFPLTPERKPYVGTEVRDYFENLLPDTKAIRERLARRFQIGATDAYSLLAKLGRDCAGALQIVPANEAPPNVQKISSRALTSAEIAAHLRRATEPSGSAFYDGEADEDFRISLAGAQEKTALLRYKGNWHRPLEATPTTHILKLPLGRVGNMQLNMDVSVENEWLCSKIIAQFGLPIASTEIAIFEDQKVLIVERFDRRLSVDKKWIMRLPQEDMCQATGTSYLQKYQADGGPGIDRIMDLLRNSKNAFVDRQVFFACQVVFWLLAATDGHAKNFSIRIDAGGEYSLTPIYDVLSVHPLLGPKAGQLAIQKTGLAMGVRGDKNMHYRLREISRRHWNITARRNGLRDGGEEIINEIIARTPSVIAATAAMLPRDFPHAVAEAIFNGLQKSANELARMAR
jgi:serine/threonine-protein kinase HipA